MQGQNRQHPPILTGFALKSQDIQIYLKTNTEINRYNAHPNVI